MPIFKTFDTKGKHNGWGYIIDIYNKEKGEKRKQKRKTGFAKRELALEAEREAIMAYKQEERLRGKGIIKDFTFKEGMKAFKEYYENRYAKSTKEKYEGLYENHILPYFAEKQNKQDAADYIASKYEDIDSATVDLWLEKLKEKNVGIPTINDCLKLCKAQSNYVLKKKQKISINPFANIDPIKEPKKNEQLQYYTPRQAVRILRRCKKVSYTFYMIMFLAFYTGMRQGEILGLRLHNVLLSKNIIQVREQYTHGELKSELKTESSYRDIIIDEKVTEELKKYIKYNGIKTGLLFTNEAGNPINKNNMIFRWYNPVIRSLKFKRIKFHDLRHTYASILLTAGVSYLFVSKQLGHSNPQITLKIYAHFIPDVNRKELDIMKKQFATQINSITITRVQKQQVAA